MGAYYGYQVVNGENKISYHSFDLEEKLRLKEFSVGGMKFLESFYEKKSNNTSIIFYNEKNRKACRCKYNL